MKVAIYRFPCEMLRALPLDPDQEAPAEIPVDGSFSHLCGSVAGCPGEATCRGMLVSEADLPSRGLRRRLRSMRGGRRS